MSSSLNIANKIKVLAVDDNPVNLNLLTALLKDAGFEIITATDSTRVVEQLRTHPDVRVVLLDRMMPNIDGLSILRGLKKSPEFWKLPIIMLTAALSRDQIETIKIEGAFECLPKPYNKDKIIATIKKAISR